MFATSNDSAIAIGVQGYDLISYHNDKRPNPGNGNFLTVHEGSIDSFATAKNKAKVDRVPKQTAATFGSYFAFSVSGGKKFVGNSDVCRLVSS